MKPWGPQSIRRPVLDEFSKERFSKERPHPFRLGRAGSESLDYVFTFSHLDGVFRRLELGAASFSLKIKLV